MKRNLALLCAAKILLTIFHLFQLGQANNTHRERAYSSNSYSLPKSQFYSDNSILLRIYLPMKDEDISYVIDSVKKFI